MAISGTKADREAFLYILKNVEDPDAAKFANNRGPRRSSRKVPVKLVEQSGQNTIPNTGVEASNSQVTSGTKRQLSEDDSEHVERAIQSSPLFAAPTPPADPTSESSPSPIPEDSPCPRSRVSSEQLRDDEYMPARPDKRRKISKTVTPASSSTQHGAAPYLKGDVSEHETLPSYPTPCSQPSSAKAARGSGADCVETPQPKVAKQKAPGRRIVANRSKPQHNSLAETEQRPEPQGQPEIWADGRQALNETLPWYRAYQSGCYTTSGFAYGFLLDAHCHERDHMDANVLITRAGGGLSKDKGTNAMIRETDQSETAQVKAVKNNMLHRNPIAFILGNQNPKNPTQAPHRYNVMDWFKPTHIWCEKSRGKAMFRYRFEKLQLQKSSWWVTQEMEIESRLNPFLVPNRERCHTCHQESEQIFTLGWMCLVSDCPRFWKLDDDTEPEEANLVYDQRFLKQYTPWDNKEEPHRLIPEIPTADTLSFLGEDVSWAAWKGIVCPKCGRCNSREHWKGWACDSVDCDFTLSVPHPIIPARFLREHYHPFATSFPMSRDKASPAISVSTQFLGNYRISRYAIGDGFIAHLTPNRAALEEPNGPNAMWEELQSKDFGLQRLELKSNQTQGKVLTQQFGLNYGMPYKFVAATQSKSFEDAPTPIRDARTRLDWASKLLQSEGHTGFNELLALGYFEKQSIDYHDDGEQGLGPVIATLSLGYPATMSIRMKDKHSRGLTKSGVFVEDEPISGCVNYEARKAAWDELQTITNRDEYKKRVAALPEELGLSLKSRREGDILQMHLTHGSIVIMSGAKIQQYYEHCVDPLGKLRYALTCRWIEEDSLKPEDRPKYPVMSDDGVYDGHKLERGVFQDVVMQDALSKLDGYTEEIMKDVGGSPEFEGITLNEDDIILAM